MDYRLKAIRDHLRAAELKASKYVEEEVKKILDAHPTTLSHFTMGMGCATFYDQHGEPIDAADRRYLETSALMNFINNYEEQLHITGEPVKIRRGQPILRDW